MKLFYTRKDFRDLVKKNNKKIEELNESHETEIENLRKIWNNEKFNLMSKNDDLEKENKKIKNKCFELEEKNKYYQNIINLKDKDIEQLSTKYKKAAGAKGGYVAQINSLIRQVTEVTEKFDKYKQEKENEIEDLKSDRYLRVTPPTKNRRRKQKMQLYSKQKTSDIIKNVKEKL